MPATTTVVTIFAGGNDVNAKPAMAPNTTVVCPPHVKLNTMIFAFDAVIIHAGNGGTRNVANAMPENALSTKCA